MGWPVSAAAVTVLVVFPLIVLWRLLRARRDFGSPAERATFETLHTASQAAPHLRAGLTAGGQKAVRHLHALLGSAAVALTDGQRLVGWSGVGDEAHSGQALGHAAGTLEAGRTQVLGPDQVSCADPLCPVRYGVVAAVTADDVVVGSVAAYGLHASTGLVRATSEVARWVSSQVELGELESARTRLVEAEVRALRAQISPHFVYNSLTAIASFVRTDPDRARGLLLEFADFTRYSFRRHGAFTTLAEELRSVDRYLVLERARFAERIQVTVRVAPEVLPVAVPFLCLQPLLENAVRHGLEPLSGTGTITVVAEDAGAEAVISVEDNGVGMDPERLRRTLAGALDGDSVGLANVDERLRAVYGDEYGLVVETAPDAGTRVTMRVPKYHPGVRAS